LQQKEAHLTYSLRGQKRLFAEWVKITIAGRFLAAMILLPEILLITPALAQTPPNLIEEVLPNGLEVTILPDQSHPVVATQVWYHVGAANETPNTRGFAHLFEHLMFGGTATHDKRDYWEHHRLYGGSDNAYTSWDETVYVSEITPEGLSGVLNLEADRMVNLKLDQQNLDNEKRIVTEELRVGTENSPFDRLEVTLLKQVLGHHPYAVTPVGTKEDIAAANLDLARDFYKRYYRPKNAHLVIVGPVDGAATLEEVRRVFGPLPAEGETPPDPPSLYGWKTPEKVEVSEDIPPVEAAIAGFLLPGPSDPDAYAIKLMNQLLAWSAVNPFEEELVRHRKKALFAATFAMEMRRGEALAFISASLPYRREKTAFRFIDETLAKLGRMEWLTDKSLAAAKRTLLRGELESRWYAAQCASRLGEARWNKGDTRAAFENAAKIEAVTRADVVAAFEKYVARGRPIRIYIRPRHVPLLVSMFGWIYPLVKR
jgi:zinc protease